MNGCSYSEHPAPLAEVGALLDARAVLTARSAYDYLGALGATHSVPTIRVDEAIQLVGLGEVARKRVGSFSLGRGQRLGSASAPGPITDSWESDWPKW
ncbi:MAG TPA: hypothetical protein VGT61_09550 [Thermomicrobiales bacterium]|nr:hypothetical protein [Thermomicrobiales bacterium]